ncbi:cell growth-regulating nucleolar protein-like [Penaeus chinensis]|uniref:cell growth-regulating nucleolar protein-like n=1 Tax=Penaeus chinensis TaxID=139456 RepID=UPI001FB755EA|nr:cell growth-regulating nucleolar protein-like [Penaeus chinensis]XP_047497587.1 cell growth-regulating nucleolar protein-like [Penaeus chinensis]
MVFFVCGSCGASLKKNQVEKHCAFRCRYVEYVSCMDCNKEFWGQEYANHFKCITEDQKYGGSNYVQKENKGEKKQEAWIAHVQEHVRITPNMDPNLQEILDRIIVFTNIPRKKTKFENFLANCMRIRDPQILERAWKVFDEAKKKEQMKKDSEGDNNKNTKEGKKRKVSDEKENDKKNGEDGGGDLEEPKKKKKKKNKHQEGEENEQANGTAMEETEAENGSTATGECPSPFKWKTAITKCLQTAPEKGLKINKLKKMVFGEYYAVHGADGHVKSETELCSLLNKKLSNRTDKYVVVKDRVKLRSEDE